MKVTITREILASINTVSVGVSKDDVTPIIMRVALTRRDDVLKAYATDRYMIVAGTYEDVVFEEWPEEGEVTFDVKTLKLATDAAKAAGRYEADKIVIESVEGESPSITVGNNTFTASHVYASTKYPPVLKLIPNPDEADGSVHLNLNPNFLARLTKVLPPVTKPERDRLWSFAFFGNGESKPRPVYASYSGDDYKMEALIQPALKK